MARMIHSMIRVLDEARSVDFYRTAFGLQVAGRHDFEGFTLVYLANPEADFELELTINKGRAETYDLGNGYGHLAVVVNDLEALHLRLTETGLSPRRITELAPDGGPLLAKFFFIADPDGYQVEVIQLGGRFR